MKIADLIPPENVAPTMVVADKGECLRTLSQLAGSRLGIPRVRINGALADREALGSTGLGRGVAIPHARLPEITNPFGMLVRLGRPIDFGAIDNQDVDLLVLLLFPERSAGDQLSALACATRFLRDPATADQLRHASNRDLIELMQGDGADR